jgi:hypothetical protein
MRHPREQARAAAIAITFSTGCVHAGYACWLEKDRLQPLSFYMWRTQRLREKIQGGCLGLQQNLLGLSRTTGRALSAAGLRRHAETLAKAEGGWDSFFVGMEEGRLAQLEYLDFRVGPWEWTWRPRLSSSPMLRLARGLQHMPNLLGLDLQGSQIGSRETVALARALAHTPRLRYLCLNNTQIGDEGMVALAPALGRLPELHALRASFCEVGPVGTVALSTELRNMPQLRAFEFYFVSGYSCYVDLVVQQFPCLRNLRVLRLRGNRMGDALAYELACVLPCLPKLRFLDIGRNGIDDAGIAAIAATLPALPHLREILMDANKFSKNGHAVIQSAAASRGLMLQWDVFVDQKTAEPGTLVRVDGDTLGVHLGRPYWTPLQDYMTRYVEL